MNIEELFTELAKELEDISREAMENRNNAIDKEQWKALTELDAYYRGVRDAVRIVGIFARRVEGE